MTPESPARPAPSQASPRHPLGAEASGRFSFHRWGSAMGRSWRASKTQPLPGIGALASQTGRFVSVVGRSIGGRLQAGHRGPVAGWDVSRLPVRPPDQYLPEAGERSHFGVSVSNEERRAQTLQIIQERMSGARRPTHLQRSAPRGLPRATARGTQSRVGRATGPAGAPRRMASTPAYVSHPADVSGTGRLLSSHDRVTVERSGTSGRPPPASPPAPGFSSIAPAAHLGPAVVSRLASATVALAGPVQPAAGRRRLRSGASLLRRAAAPASVALPRPAHGQGAPRPAAPARGHGPGAPATASPSPGSQPSLPRAAKLAAIRPVAAVLSGHTTIAGPLPVTVGRPLLLPFTVGRSLPAVSPTAMRVVLGGAEERPARPSPTAAAQGGTGSLARRPTDGGAAGPTAARTTAARSTKIALAGRSFVHGPAGATAASARRPARLVQGGRGAHTMVETSGRVWQPAPLGATMGAALATAALARARVRQGEPQLRAGPAAPGPVAGRPEPPARLSPAASPAPAGPPGPAGRTASRHAPAPGPARLGPGRPTLAAGAGWAPDAQRRVQPGRSDGWAVRALPDRARRPGPFVYQVRSELARTRQLPAVAEPARQPSPSGTRSGWRPTTPPGRPERPASAAGRRLALRHALQAPSPGPAPQDRHAVATRSPAHRLGATALLPVATRKPALQAVCSALSAVQRAQAPRHPPSGPAARPTGPAARPTGPAARSPLHPATAARHPVASGTGQPLRTLPATGLSGRRSGPTTAVRAATRPAWRAAGPELRPANAAANQSALGRQYALGRRLPATTQLARRGHRSEHAHLSVPAVPAPARSTVPALPPGAPTAPKPPTPRGWRAPRRALGHSPDATATPIRRQPLPAVALTHWGRNTRVTGPQARPWAPPGTPVTATGGRPRPHAGVGTPNASTGSANTAMRASAPAAAGPVHERPASYALPRAAGMIAGARTPLRAERPTSAPASGGGVAPVLATTLALALGATAKPPLATLARAALVARARSTEGDRAQATSASNRSTRARPTGRTTQPRSADKRGVASASGEDRLPRSRGTLARSLALHAPEALAVPAGASVLPGGGPLHSSTARLRLAVAPGPVPEPAVATSSAPGPAVPHRLALPRPPSGQSPAVPRRRALRTFAPSVDGHDTVLQPSPPGPPARAVRSAPAVRSEQRAGARGHSRSSPPLPTLHRRSRPAPLDRAGTPGGGQPKAPPEVVVPEIVTTHTAPAHLPVAPRPVHVAAARARSASRAAPLAGGEPATAQSPMGQEPRSRAVGRTPTARAIDQANDDPVSGSKGGTGTVSYSTGRSMVSRWTPGGRPGGGRPTAISIGAGRERDVPPAAGPDRSAPAEPWVPRSVRLSEELDQLAERLASRAVGDLEWRGSYLHPAVF